MSFDYVLYDMSYENLILYGATIPSYYNDSKDNKYSGQTSNNNEVIRADDPANWSRMRSLFKNSR